MEYIFHYSSPIGRMTAVSDGKALCGLCFNGQRYAYKSFGIMCECSQLPIFDMTSEWLDIYFSGKAPDFTPPLKLEGTPFRMMVWELLMTIPFGETVSYGELAAMVAERKGVTHMSAQAIGGAVSHNMISVIVPCHRIIGANGSMTGYDGGILIKQRLLDNERGIPLNKIIR